MNAFVTVALVALFAQFGTCEDSVDKDGTELMEKRGAKINYRRLARGLHMLRLGKRGAPAANPFDYGFEDGDTLLPYENYEEHSPLGEQYQLPASSSEILDSDNFYGPEEGGIEEGVAKRPMNMLRLGKRGLNMIRLGKRRTMLLRLGKRAMNMLRLGKRPMSMLRLGRSGIKVRPGKRPMSMLRLGKRPSDSEEVEKRPMSMLRLGKRPQSG